MMQFLLLCTILQLFVVPILTVMLLSGRFAHALAIFTAAVVVIRVLWRYMLV